MQFHYVAYSRDGGVVKGRVAAPSEVEARQEISREGYKPLRVRPVRQWPPLEEMFPSLFQVGSGQLVRFARQLAIMFRGGSSLQRALQMLQSESHNRMLRRILSQVRQAVDEGDTLSSALARYPKVFNPRFVSVVEVGEHTGRLAPALEQLADSLEKEQAVVQKARRTMMMPAFTMAASAVMLVLMLTVMLPPLLDNLEKMGSDIPLITRIAIGLVDTLSGNLKLLLLGAGVAIAMLWLLRRIPSTRLAMHGALTRVPLVGAVVVAKELAQFSRTVAMLLEAGVPLASALPLAIGGCKNLALRRAFAEGEESLLSGHGFAAAVGGHRALPRVWVELVIIGEESNSLGPTMSDLADAFQKELEDRLGSLLGVLEPLATFAVGGVVLFMALSMFLPIYGGLGAVE